jgi:hypothetical protein
VEYSRFWATNGIGDGAAPYTQDQFTLFWREFFGHGVIPDLGNDLLVTGSASPLQVASGGAFVRGFPYRNDSALSVPVPGVASTTGGRVVLEANWMAQTVRAVAVLNAVGVTAPPALVQTQGVVWQEPLATFTIDGDGVIVLEDTRSFALYRPRATHRRGGDVTNWRIAGTNNYAVNGIPLTQYGMASIAVPSGQEYITGSIAFPRAYKFRPLVFVSPIHQLTFRPRVGWAGDSFNPVTGFIASVTRSDPSNTASAEEVLFSWMAVGEG